MNYPIADYNLLRFTWTRFRVRFCLFMAGTIACIVGAFTVPGLWWIAMVAFAVGIQLILWLGSRSHRATLRALNAAPSGSPHRKEVCEGCDPPCWNDGSPLTDIVDWYAASMHKEVDDARVEIGNMPPGGYASLQIAHRKYLDHPKFDKFLRP